MTVEKPIDSAHVWFVNATEEPIDIYVNFADEPAITDQKPLELGSEYEVKGRDDTPYGTYTFSARYKGLFLSRVLAAVSIEFSAGRSFTAAFHQLPDRSHRLSVYENDFTPSDAPRMTVRHTARPKTLAWGIAPKEFKNEIPADPRQGELNNGQWQVASDVVQRDYRFEALLDGQVVAVHPDLELEHEKDRTVYLVGDPYPTDVTGTLRRFVLEQEFKLPRGAPPSATVTLPAEPYATTDRNRRIEFDCRPLTLWQANRGSTTVFAVDPDGVVTDLALASVDPQVDGILIADHAVLAANAIGGQATAVLDVLADVPPGTYEVMVVSNVRSQGERATCALQVTVRATTIERVRNVAAHYKRAGAVDEDVYVLLETSLEQAQQALSMGQTTEACQHLKDAVALIGSEKDKGIVVEVAERMEREVKALRSNLGCG